jgi:hypothetical protein
MPSPGGQTSGIASHQNRRRQGPGGRDVASPRPPSRATTRQPGGRAAQRTRRSRRGLPPSWRAVGLRQADGTPHSPRRARSTLGPSLGRRTSRSIEKPGEAPRAFLLANPTASAYWRRWRSAGRTSWPVSRILPARITCLGRWLLHTGFTCSFSVGQRWQPLAVCGGLADSSRTARDQPVRPCGLCCRLRWVFCDSPC